MTGMEEVWMMAVIRGDLGDVAFYLLTSKSSLVAVEGFFFWEIEEGLK